MEHNSRVGCFLVAILRSIYGRFVLQCCVWLMRKLKCRFLDSRLPNSYKNYSKNPPNPVSNHLHSTGLSNAMILDFTFWLSSFVSVLSWITYSHEDKIVKLMSHLWNNCFCLFREFTTWSTFLCGIKGPICKCYINHLKQVASNMKQQLIIQLQGPVHKQRWNFFYDVLFMNSSTITHVTHHLLLVFMKCEHSHWHPHNQF